MALVSCYECKSQLSDKALRCPKCGAPNSKAKKESGEKNTIQVVERFVKAATLIYGFLVFCGAIYFHFYYNTFHVNIFRYLDTSEILISFLHILIPVLSSFALIAFYFLSARITVDLFRKKTITSEKSDRLIRVLQNIWLFILIGVGIWYLSMAHKKLSIDYTVNSNRALYWLLFLSATGIILLLKYNLSLIITAVSMCLLITTVFVSIGDTQATLEDASTSQANIITDEKDTIRTDSNYFFVGRTNRYVFLYNRNTGENDYIPVDKIRRISFKRIK